MTHNPNQRFDASGMLLSTQKPEPRIGRIAEPEVEEDDGLFSDVSDGYADEDPDCPPPPVEEKDLPVRTFAEDDTTYP